MDSIQTPTRLKERESTPRKILSIPPSPFLEKLGYGTGVNVWKLNQSSIANSVQSPWAIKSVRKNINTNLSNTYQSLLRKEADILKSLNHENIIGFRGYLQADDGRNCLAMEVGGESLGNLIEKRYENKLGPYPAASILKVALCVAKALKYLHMEKKILHGDIKSFNIVVKDNFQEIKLCDFGVSLDLNDEKLSEKYVGTSIYSAPECQKGSDKAITEKSDIFSFGLVLWEMISLCPPHMQDFLNEGAYCESDLNESIISSDDSFFTPLSDNDDESFNEENYGTRPPLPSGDLGPEYLPIIEIFYACTEQDPDKRPSAALLVDYLQTILKE